MRKFPILLFALMMLACEAKLFPQNIIPNAVTDIDGNSYNAVKIGDQVWLAENMRAKHDRDGNTIALGHGSELIRYYPDNNSKNVRKYGYLYNWEAAAVVCPNGWHLPTGAEWLQLKNYVESQGQYVCGEDKKHIAKALASTYGWNSCEDSSPWDICSNSSSNNVTGFCALPAGDIEGHFGVYARFWSAPDANEYSSITYQSLYYANGCVSAYYYIHYDAFSVRCVKD